MIDRSAIRSRCLRGAAGILVVLVLATAGCGGGSGHDAGTGKRALGLASERLATDPSSAALFALAADRLAPSVASELSMLDVATGADGIERVLDLGRPPAAAIRTTHLVVGVDRGGEVSVWRPSGRLVGEARLKEGPIALADCERTHWVVGADAQGRLSLIDLTDPTRPVAHYLHASVTDGRPLALAFSEDGATVEVVTDRGELEKFDSTTGARLAGWSLREASGNPPWSKGSPLALRVATFGSDGADSLLVATSDGAVGRVRLGRRSGETVLSAGTVPGRIVSLAQAPYLPSIAIASTGGVTMLKAAGADPDVIRGSSATGVAFDSEGHLWVADRDGVTFDESLPRSKIGTFEGGPATALTVGAGGIVAIGGDAISLLGPQNSGLSVAETYETAIATFDSQGNLVTESGSPGYVYQLETQRPGYKMEDGIAEDDPEIRSFEPSPGWWPEEEEHGLYLDGAAADEEFVVAGGQAPTGQGVVLVWSARDGKPLRRLNITTATTPNLQAGVVTEVVLLPGKHLVAAYSPVFKVVEIWSTKTWKYVGDVPVGHLKSLQASPDESELLAVEIPDPETEGESAADHSKLIFIDASDPHIDHVVDIGSASAAAWSPDDERIAVADEDGSLEFRSADGQKANATKIELPSEGVAMAWRPDGRVLAVSLGTSIVLVDPDSGEVSSPLPRRPKDLIPRLEWSPDGRFLAATTIVLSSSEEEEGTYQPGPAQLWTLGNPRLERRMCQIAGGGLSDAEWNRRLGGGAAARPLCRTQSLRRPRTKPSAQLNPIEPTLAYRSGNHLFVAGVKGESAVAAAVQSAPYQPLDAIWADGRLGWSGGGQVGLFTPGSPEAETWPCACNGAVPTGGSLVALENGGRRLMVFTPGDPLPRSIDVAGNLGEGARLLGILGGVAIVGSYPADSEAAPAGQLYTIDRDGTAHRLVARIRDGIPGMPAAESPAGDSLLFATEMPSGDCLTTGVVGLVRLVGHDRFQVSFPPTPFGEEERSVRSLVAHDDALEAGLAPPSCTDGSGISPTVATRYVLDGAGWDPTGIRGFDVQSSESGTVRLGKPQSPAGGGALSIQAPSGGTTVLAHGVQQVWVKP